MVPALQPLSVDGALSQHFTLAELTASDLAARLGIDNTPDVATVERLRGTAARMEAVRAILRVPIVITSGYRSEALERALCKGAFRVWCQKYRMEENEASWRLYFDRKAHPKGRAVDFRAPRFGTPIEICRELARYADELGFDQLIHEFGAWVHIGWAPDTARPRKELLTVDAHGTRPGLFA